MEVQYGKSMQALRADERWKFISIKLKKFYDRWRIKIKYVVPYIHKENSIVQWG